MPAAVRLKARVEDGNKHIYAQRQHSERAIMENRQHNNVTFLQRTQDLWRINALEKVDECPDHR